MRFLKIAFSSVLVAFLFTSVSFADRAEDIEILRNLQKQGFDNAAELKEYWCERVAPFLVSKGAHFARQGEDFDRAVEARMLELVRAGEVKKGTSSYKVAEADARYFFRFAYDTEGSPAYLKNKAWELCMEEKLLPQKIVDALSAARRAAEHLARQDGPTVTQAE